MNKNTRIIVQTPMGTTDESDIGEGALVSAVNLYSGVNMRLVMEMLPSNPSCFKMMWPGSPWT